MKIHLERTPIFRFIVTTLLVLTAAASVSPVMAATPPAVSTTAAAEITNVSVTLIGNLNSLGTAASVSVAFEYGKTTLYGSNTTVQSMTAIGEFSTVVTGITPGTLYHFRAKADGGTEGKATGADITFTTLTPPTVQSGAVTGINTTSVTLNGTLSSLGSPAKVNVYFEYGTTISYGSVSSSTEMPNTGNFSIQVSGLSPGVAYHFRAKADGGVAGITSGSDVTFTTAAILPRVNPAAVSAVTTTGARADSRLTSLGSAPSVSVSFDYGTSTTYGSNVSAGSMTATGTFSADLTSLTPGTTYYLRAKADGGTHGISYSDGITFTTNAGIPPSIGFSGVSNVTNDGATLSGNLELRGTAATVNVFFEYGLTTNYGNTTTPQGLASTGYAGGFSAVLTGLNQGTTYHFRAVADGGADGKTTSQDMIFTTSGIRVPVAPVVDSLSATAIETTSATLNGKITSLGTAPDVKVFFEYGVTTDYGSVSAIQTFSKTGDFAVLLRDLKPATTYHFRARIDGGNEGRNYGKDTVFVTGTVPPEVISLSPSDITVNSVSLSGQVISLGTAAEVKVSFEYGRDTKYGFTTIPQKLAAPGTFTFKVTGLVSGATYHFRSKIDGGTHGTAAGLDTVFTTQIPSKIGPVGNSLRITPAAINTGENVNITATFSNSGGTAGTISAALTINGQPETATDITIEPGANKTVTFNVTRKEAGTYNLDLNGLKGTFTVTAKTISPSTTTAVTVPTQTPKKAMNYTQIILYAVAGAAVIGLIVFLIIRRRNS